MNRLSYFMIGAGFALLTVQGSALTAAVPGAYQRHTGAKVSLGFSFSLDDTQAYQVAGKGPKAPRPARAAKPKPLPKAKANPKPKGVSGAAKRAGGKIKQTTGRAVQSVKKSVSTAGKAVKASTQKTKAALSQAKTTVSAALRGKTAPTKAQTAQQKPTTSQFAARKPVSLVKKRPSFQASQYGSKSTAAQKTSKIPAEKKVAFQKPANASGRVPSARDQSNTSKEARDWRKQVSQRYGTKSQFKTAATGQGAATTSSGTRADQAKPTLERKDWQQTSPGGQGPRRDTYKPKSPNP